MGTLQPYSIKTISELHKLFGLSQPEHPLLSVIDIEPFVDIPTGLPKILLTNFYFISLKKGFKAPVKIKYGQQEYDFDEGVLAFMSPGQVFGLDIEKYASPNQSGWMLFIHPDFLWNTSLTKKVRQYDFFDYSVNEALFLSDKEEAAITQIIQTIRQEYRANIDKFSHNIIISLLETMLNYSERFYQRQFLTRRKTSHRLLDQLEDLLTDYFNDDDISHKGLPTVGYIAEKLQVSPDYLSGLLKTLTGLNAQQHIHQKLIEKAKEKLSTTNLSVSEIAYQLGFEYPQSFSKLFKTKTSLSPVAFRQSFN
jgi:AraC family transcriptional regulator, transcriptional activator of pobA